MNKNIESDEIEIFEIDSKKRDEYLKSLKMTFLLTAFIIPAISFLLLFVLPKNLYDSNLLGFILGIGALLFIPGIFVFGISYVSKKTLFYVQKIFFQEGKLKYKYAVDLDDFNVPTDERYVLESLDHYKITKRNIKIYGEITDEEKKGYEKNYKKKRTKHKMVIVRILKNEDRLLEVLKNYSNNR